MVCLIFENIDLQKQNQDTILSRNLVKLVLEYIINFLGNKHKRLLALLHVISKIATIILFSSIKITFSIRNNGAISINDK